MIATDNQGEQTAEIVDRIIGLSPSVLNVRLQRASGRVSLFLTASGADELPVNFQFTLDKMVYYRMRTARADVTGMTEALQEAKAVEPLLREVGYRFDGRYSIIDLTLDLRPGDQGGARDAGAPRGRGARRREARLPPPPGPPRRPGRRRRRRPRPRRRRRPRQGAAEEARAAGEAAARRGGRRERGRRQGRSRPRRRNRVRRRRNRPGRRPPRRRRTSPRRGSAAEPAPWSTVRPRTPPGRRRSRSPSRSRAPRAR